MKTYYLLEQLFDREEYCSLDSDFGDHKACHRPSLGKILGDKYEKTYDFTMRKEFPRFIIPDYVHTPHQYPIVSMKLKELFEQYQQEIEYLDINIINHKGKKVDETYQIANALTVLDCVNKEKSVAKNSHFAPERFSYAEYICLDQDKIPENTHIFRLKAFPRYLIVSEELAIAMCNAEITGVTYYDLDEEIDLGE